MSLDNAGSVAVPVRGPLTLFDLLVDAAAYVLRYTVVEAFLVIT